MAGFGSARLLKVTDLCRLAKIDLVEDVFSLLDQAILDEDKGLASGWRHQKLVHERESIVTGTLPVEQLLQVWLSLAVSSHRQRIFCVQTLGVNHFGLFLFHEQRDAVHVDLGLLELEFIENEL